MTAASPMVLLLLGVAVVVAICFVLIAIGRLPATMEPPHDPWWAGRQRRRHRADERRDARDPDSPADGIGM